jgi:hypothetical protein
VSRIVGLILVVIGAGAFAMAQDAHWQQGPEIDPASGASALALAAGTLILIRGRRKKRSPRV